MALRMKAWADAVLEEAGPLTPERAGAGRGQAPGTPPAGPAHWLQDVQALQAGAAAVWDMRAPGGRGARRWTPEGPAVPPRAGVPLHRRRPRALAPAPLAEAPAPPPAPAPVGEALRYPWPESPEALSPEPTDTMALLHQWARLRGLELEPWGE
jgi:hypothetical protein